MACHLGGSSLLFALPPQEFLLGHSFSAVQTARLGEVLCCSVLFALAPVCVSVCVFVFVCGVSFPLALAIHCLDWNAGGLEWQPYTLWQYGLQINLDARLYQATWQGGLQLMFAMLSCKLFALLDLKHLNL